MVTSAEDMRRLARNRRRRDLAAAERLFNASIEEMYDLDDIVGDYLAEHSDYIDQHIKEAVAEGCVQYKLPLRVGFDYARDIAALCKSQMMDDDWCRCAWLDPNDPAQVEPVVACIFDSRFALGTSEYNFGYVAFAFCEVLAEIYADAGWQVSDIDTTHEFWQLYDSISSYSFEGLVEEIKQRAIKGKRVDELLPDDLRMVRYAYSFELKY